MSKEVILRLLCDAQLIASNLSPLSSTLEYLSTQFKCRHDKQKFDICQLLKDMIMVGENTTKDSEQVWLADIAVGLQDILQSKLGQSCIIVLQLKYYEELQGNLLLHMISKRAFVEGV